MGFCKTSCFGALFGTPPSSSLTLVSVPQRVLNWQNLIITLPADVVLDSLDFDLVLWRSVCYNNKKSSLLNCFFLIYGFGLKLMLLILIVGNV